MTWTTITRISVVRNPGVVGSPVSSWGVMEVGVLGTSAGSGPSLGNRGQPVFGDPQASRRAAPGASRMRNPPFPCPVSIGDAGEARIDDEER